MTTRIALVAYCKSSSGIAIYTEELAKALSAGGFNVVLPALGLDAAQRGESGHYGVKVIEMGRDPVELDYLGGPLVGYKILSRKMAKTLVPLQNFNAITFTILGFATSFPVRNFFVKSWSYLGTLQALMVGLKYLPIALKLPSILTTIQYSLMDMNVFRKAYRIICSTHALYEF